MPKGNTPEETIDNAFQKTAAVLFASKKASVAISGGSDSDIMLDLADKFRFYADRAKHKPHGMFGAVYMLTNYNSTMEENLYRIYTLRDLGYNPYVMIYNKPSAPQEIKDLQRWCNNRMIFRSAKTFEEYRRNK